MRNYLILLVFVLFTPPLYGKHNSDHPLTEQEWREVMENVTLLEDSAFLPSLLPIIMTNRDALSLTDEQLERFYHWRRDNYVNMVNIMNRIIELKVQFSIEALSPDVSREHLIEFQNEIFRLQHELMMIRLTCRDIVVETFTKEQWESFEFIVADDIRLASFASQASLIREQHRH